jgi:hypothetical protein
MKHPVFKFAAITSLLLVTGLGGSCCSTVNPHPKKRPKLSSAMPVTLFHRSTRRAPRVWPPTPG